MIDAVKSTGKKGVWKNINLLEVKKKKIDKVMIPINKSAISLSVILLF